MTDAATPLAIDANAGNQTESASPAPDGSELLSRPSRDGLRVVAIASALAALPVSAAAILGWSAGLDRQLLLTMRAGVDPYGPLGPLWLQEAVRDVTALGSTVILTSAVTIAALLLFAARRARLGALLVLSALGATAFSSILKMVVDRARPELGLAQVTTYTASFPSGHALLTAAIILTIGGLVAFAAPSRAERAVLIGSAITVTLAVGVSRVYLGVHWPTDVLAGWLIGASWACATLYMASRTGVATRDGVVARSVTSAGVVSSPGRNS